MTLKLGALLRAQTRFDLFRGNQTRLVQPGDLLLIVRLPYPNWNADVLDQDGCIWEGGKTTLNNFCDVVSSAPKPVKGDVP